MKIHGFRVSFQPIHGFEETGAVAAKVQFQRRGAMLAARQRRGASGRKVREFPVEVFGSIGSPFFMGKPWENHGKTMGKW